MGGIVFGSKHVLPLILFFLILTTSTFFAATSDETSSYFNFYIKKTREFLYHLHCPTYKNVPIKKVSNNKKSIKEGWIRYGYTDGKAIYLNQEIFAQEVEGLNLFTCAHEAAHYALRHPFDSRSVIEIEKEADIVAAQMLCSQGYSWVVNEQLNYLKAFIDAGQGNQHDGEHPSSVERYEYLAPILAEYTNSLPSYDAHITVAVDHWKHEIRQDIQQFKKLIRNYSCIWTQKLWKLFS